MAQLAAAAQSIGLPAVDYTSPEYKAKLAEVIQQFSEGKSQEQLKEEWQGQSEADRQAKFVALLQALKEKI